MNVSIRLLGGFAVGLGGHNVIDEGWRPAKAAALVKILALQHGRTLHREQLIDLLWPDADAEAGSGSFYKILHHLRAATQSAGISRLVTLKRGAVSLDAAAEIDVDAFREAARVALERGDVASFEQALAVCSGDLLPSDLYEPWTEPHRGEIRALQHRLRLEVADRYLERGRIDDGIRQFNLVLSVNALSEQAHRGLIRAYGTNGQRELALQQYERCKDILAADLGTAPSAETEALVTEIRTVDRLTNRIDAAIGDNVSAGDAAMQRYAWEEASEQYRRAVDTLQTMDHDDEREAELWLKLAQATGVRRSTLDVVEYIRRAVQLARRSGAIEVEARALAQFQDATDAIPNNHVGHREARELILDALERLPAGPSASRAILLASSARPLSAGARQDDEKHITGRLSVAGERATDIEQRLRDAVDIARQVGNAEVLASTLARLRVYITSPDTLSERLNLTDEMLRLSATARHPVRQFEARLMRHEDLLEHGDIDGARIQAREVRRIGDAMQLNGILAVAGSLLATHATADGDLGGGKKLLFESREVDAQRGDNANSMHRFGIQMLMLRWHEGRIAEMHDPYRRTVDLLPRVKAIRSIFAFVCAESGRLDAARAELDVLAADGLDTIPRDYLWWLAMISLSRVAIATDVPDVASDVYHQLLPFADRNAATSGAVSFGSASLVLGQLAAFLGRRDEAERHYAEALSFNLRTRQRTWVAHTRFHYAALLAGRDQPRARELARIAAADAREIGMPVLGEQIGRLALLDVPAS